MSDLKQACEDAEAKAHSIQAERDAAITQIRATYDEQLRAANNEAANAQKAWRDAVAAEALLDRPDGEAVAKALGLHLPTAD